MKILLMKGANKLLVGAVSNCAGIECPSNSKVHHKNSFAAKVQTPINRN